MLYMRNVFLLWVCHCYGTHCYLGILKLCFCEISTFWSRFVLEILKIMHKRLFTHIWRSGECTFKRNLFKNMIAYAEICEGMHTSSHHFRIYEFCFRLFIFTRHSCTGRYCWERVLAMGILSVCPSVTTRCYTRPRWDRDSGSSPYDSLESLLSNELIWCRWVRRFPSNEGIKEGYPP